MSGQEIRAILYLQRRIVVNWVRRSTRSIVIWVLAIGAIFFVGTGVIFGGGTDTGQSPPEDASIPVEYFQTGAVCMLLGLIVVGFWRGTGKPPRATLADVVFILGSPMSARLKYAYLMLREAGGTLLFIGGFALLSVTSSLVQGLSTGEAGAGEILDSPTLIIFLILLIGEMIRLAVWVATEQVVARDIAAGFRLRRWIRISVAAAGVALLLFLILPAVSLVDESWRSAADEFTDRVLAVAVVPPLSWTATALSENGSPLPALGGLFGIAALIGALGLYAARDFVEPIAVTAERQTDARGQATESGKDLQWSAMSQLGSARRLRFSLPPFGSGPWALLWSSIVRWVRYQLSVAWISGIALIVIGGGVAFLVRFDVVSHYWAWGLILTTPLFGSYNMFLDELRKPFIFLTPGPAWARIAAAGSTSVFDSFISSAATAALLAATGARPVAEAVVLVLAAGALSFLTQATVGLVQIVLPTWLWKKLRTGLTFTATVVAIMPAAGAFLAGLALSGLAVAAAAGIMVALASAAVVLALASWLFDRLELPG